MWCIWGTIGTQGAGGWGAGVGLGISIEVNMNLLFIWEEMQNSHNIFTLNVRCKLEWAASDSACWSLKGTFSFLSSFLGTS